MKKKRPVNLNLFTIHFPLPAIVSILHRISGVFLFLLIPAVVWLLGETLTSAQRFYEIRAMVMQPWVKVTLWVSLMALGYHLIAGTRHLIMDLHIGDSLQGGRIGAYIVLIMTFALGAGLGVLLW